MSRKRKQYSSDFKAKAALAALKDDQTTSETAARFETHPTIVSQWKRELLDNASGIFENKSGKPAQKSQEEVGKRRWNGIFITQARSLSRAQHLALIEPLAPDASLRRQCQLLGISRYSVYYQPRGMRADYLLLMRLIDEERLRTPAYGSRNLST